MAAPTRKGTSSQDENQPLESPLGIGLMPPSAQFPEGTPTVDFRLAMTPLYVLAPPLRTLLRTASQ